MKLSKSAPHLHITTNILQTVDKSQMEKKFSQTENVVFDDGIEAPEENYVK